MNNPQADQAPAQSVEDRISNVLFGDQPESEPETEAEPEVQASDESDEGEGAAPSAEELAEVEYEGERFRIPKKLEKAVMQERDYTRKTQELADQRRAVELTQQQFRISQLNQEFESAVSQERQQAAVLDAYLAQAQRMNWAGMTTDEIVRAKLDLDNAKEARANIDRTIEAKRAEFQQKMAAQYQDYLGQAKQYLAKAIPGWTDATAQDIVQHAINDGYTKEELNSITDPRYVRTLWKAREFDRLQAERVQAKGKAESAPVLKPGAVKPMPSEVKQKLAFRKQLQKFPQGSPQRNKVAADRIADIFSR